MQATSVTLPSRIEVAVAGSSGGRCRGLALGGIVAGAGTACGDAAPSVVRAATLTAPTFATSGQRLARSP